MKDQTKIIAALLAGAAAGVALGLLLAPDSGESLRSDIADYVNDLVSTAKEKVQSTAGDLKEYSNSAFDKATSAYEKAKSKISGEVENLKDYALIIIAKANQKLKLLPTI